LDRHDLGYGWRQVARVASSFLQPANCCDSLSLGHSYLSDSPGGLQDEQTGPLRVAGGPTSRTGFGFLFHWLMRILMKDGC
jgi:hypothetical protein